MVGTLVVKSSCQITLSFFIHYQIKSISYLLAFDKLLWAFRFDSESICRYFRVVKRFRSDCFSRKASKKIFTLSRRNQILLAHKTQWNVRILRHTNQNNTTSSTTKKSEQIVQSPAALCKRKKGERSLVATVVKGSWQPKMHCA